MTKRALAVTMALLAGLTLPALPAMAGGGGGCHGGTTQGTGTTVELAEACFTPTTIRIAPGDTVTFVNRDPVTHNVVGDGWGHTDDLERGDAFTATFEDPGVYPYACMYHWGMTGAVVVGDGVGIGTEVHVAPLARPAPSPIIQVRTVREAGTASPAMWLAAGAIGVMLGLGLGAIRRRRRAAA
ncbi:MAG TPA: plastocyanin/azurin family copper-binding protein [Actinomycetota bacterium]|jgi:plastocyanin|nr:plastocyanin/azurin family copper-binding protein [Actinomycetota bacterium]